MEEQAENTANVVPEKLMDDVEEVIEIPELMEVESGSKKELDIVCKKLDLDIKNYQGFSNNTSSIIRAGTPWRHIG